MKWTASVAVLLSVAGLFVLSQRGPAQAPVKDAGTDNQAERAPTLHDILEQRIDTRTFQSPSQTLKEFFGILYLLFDKKGMKLPILVDAAAFKAEDPDDFILDNKVKFPAFPPEMTVATALGIALSQIPSNNATYVVMADHILVTTYAKTAVEAKLKEKVRGVFDKRSLESALSELSGNFGVTITLDARAAGMAKKEVSASFRNDISLAGALRVLTEMADLKVVVVDGAIFVTTPVHAEAIAKEQTK